MCIRDSNHLAHSPFLKNLFLAGSKTSSISLSNGRTPVSYTHLDVYKRQGILNATPDSFYNQGRDSDTDSILRNAERMLGEGAKILDVGGASTKPGSAIIDADEELKLSLIHI